MAYTTTGINTSSTIVAPAGAAITGAAGKAMKFDTSGNLVLCDTAGEAAAGIAVITAADTIAQGEDVDIQIKEIGKVRVGAAVAKGAELAVNANGLLVTATAGQFVIGMALDAATAENQIINAQIVKYYKAAAQG